MESGLLRDAVRLSTSLSSSAARSASDNFNERDPRFRKIVEGLIYTRKLVPTYNIVILAIIFLLSLLHWTERLRRWRKRQVSKLYLVEECDRDANAETVVTSSCMSADNAAPYAEGTCSSGSSTVEGSASPPRKDIDENTPLLKLSHSLKPLQPRRTMISIVKAFLMYQPRPIPIVNKTLPSNGTSAVILVFLALNGFYMFFRINLNIFELFVLADRFGLLFVANLPLLYLTAAKNQPLKLLTGRSYESLNIFHRRLGEVLCFDALVHTAGMFGVWYTLFHPIGFTLVQFLFKKVIILGVGAFMSYKVLYFTSLASFRQRWYELFLGSHIILQIAALVLVFFHHPNGRPYVGTALGIFLVDRLVYRLQVKSVSLDFQTKLMDDEETLKLSTTIERLDSKLPRILKASIKNGWDATDHVFITIASLSRTHMVQAHPFTIFSAPPAPDVSDMKLELLVRAQNGFSRDVLNAARLHKTLQVRVDGPYGSTHAREMLENSDLAVVIAGGSGIAVGFPLVHHLLDHSSSMDPEFAYHSALRKQKIVLIWVIRESTQILWLGRHALADADNKGVEIIIPRATEEIGRPDLATIIAKDIVGTFANTTRKKIRVVASGPDSMGRLVRNTCAKLRREGTDIDVAVEKFGW